MVFGNFCLMMILFTRINTAWWLDAPMVSNAEYTLESLHILRTTQKSKQVSIIASLQSTDYLNDRVLLATIRDKGLCPCPRCLISKLKLDETGMKLDSNFRLKNARTYLYDSVVAARNAIYKSANAIAGVVVNRLLKATSSVPTVVSKNLSAYNCALILKLLYPRMHLPINLVSISISLACSLLIFCMSLNWVSGRPFSFT